MRKQLSRWLIGIGLGLLALALLGLALPPLVGLAGYLPDGLTSAYLQVDDPDAPFEIWLPLALNNDDGSNAGGGDGDAEVSSHEGYYTVYEGSKTCNECHLEQALEVHGSVHYQWQGPTPDVHGMDVGGKLGGINDFCGYPDINFIGLLTNLDGVRVSGGCAGCHVGMGLKPASEATQEQVENIDCLICHSETYRRKVVETEAGFRYAPAPEMMDVPLETAITDITKPNRATCVACHAYAGGGCNNKRGDIESAHIDPPSAEFDVHMASRAKGGAGLACTDCHVTEDHRIAGRGVDLRPTDLDTPVRCQNCHEERPHHEYQIDNHTARVDCTVCHIPYFAKITSTDMFRDYRSVDVLEDKRLYEPHIERQAQVVPEYRFWDGTSTFYQFGDPAVLGDSGRLLMAGPVGDITDPQSKLFAFKYHQALQPYDPVTQRLLPMKMGVLFQFGDIERAVLQGVAELGWELTQGYEYLPTDRYMGIFHEVSPADDALECADCHASTDRMDLAAMGYGPRNERDGQPLCASCHEDESDEWDPDEYFTKVHDKHVKDKKIDCAECHTFSRIP